MNVTVIRTRPPSLQSDVEYICLEMPLLPQCLQRYWCSLLRICETLAEKKSVVFTLLCTREVALSLIFQHPCFSFLPLSILFHDSSIIHLVSLLSSPPVSSWRVPHILIVMQQLAILSFFFFFSIKHYMLLYQSAVLAEVCFNSNCCCISHFLLGKLPPSLVYTKFLIDTLDCHAFFLFSTPFLLF